MKSSLGEMRVAVVSRVNVQVQFGGKATEILFQDGVKSIRHQNSNRSGLRSTFTGFLLVPVRNIRARTNIQAERAWSRRQHTP